MIEETMESKVARAFAKPGPVTPEQWAGLLARAADAPDLIAEIRYFQNVEPNRWAVRALAAEAWNRGKLTGLVDMEALRLAGKSDSDVQALVSVLQTL